MYIKKKTVGVKGDREEDVVMNGDRVIYCPWKKKKL